MNGVLSRFVSLNDYNSQLLTCKVSKRFLRTICRTVIQHAVPVQAGEKSPPVASRASQGSVRIK